MGSTIDSQPLSFPCQRCGQTMTHSIARLKQDPDLVCPNCGQITPVDAKQLGEAISNTANAGLAR